MADVGGLVKALEESLRPHGFVPRPGDGWVAAWTRKTWNTNRAVAVVTVPAGVDPVAYVASERARLGAALGYVPFFYEVGIQLVLVGAGGGPVEGALDRVNNQRFVVQSVFLVDPERETVVAARTWGQVVTGRFQDAVAAGVDRWLGKPTSPVPAVEAPIWGKALPWLVGALLVLGLARLLMGLG